MLSIIQNDHGEVLQKLDRLEKALNGLHFEGNSVRQKHIADTKDVLQFFENSILPHFQLEEKVLFTFVEDHIPRLQEAIQVLILEHKEFQKYFEEFKLLSESCFQEGQGSACNVECHHKGTYLILHLRNHIKQEEILFKIVEETLNPEEKQDLKSSLETN